MPQQTVYIREVDMDRWKSLEKKSEFIHKALNPEETDEMVISPDGVPVKRYDRGRFPYEVKGKPIKPKVSTQGVSSASTSPSTGIFKTKDDVPFETFFKKGKK